MTDKLRKTKLSRLSSAQRLAVIHLNGANHDIAFKNGYNKHNITSVYLYTTVRRNNQAENKQTRQKLSISASSVCCYGLGRCVIVAGCGGGKAVVDTVDARGHQGDEDSAEDFLFGGACFFGKACMG